MVIVKQAHQSDEHILKVKSVLKGYEEEVKRSDLISWLHRSLSQQAVIENTNRKLSRTSLGAQMLILFLF